MTEPDWDLANCKGTDTELFFPISVDRATPAKTICSRCEIRGECLDWAIDTRQQHGIWGGLTEKERAYRVRKSATMLLAQQRYRIAQQMHQEGHDSMAIARRLQLTVQTVDRMVRMAPTGGRGRVMWPTN